MRIDDPNITLLKNRKQILIFQKLQANNNILERLSDFDPAGDFALIIKQNNIFNRWIILSKSKYFSFIGCNRNHTAK
jgi:hypothetical protein